MCTKNPYRVLLYYKYVPIDNTETFKEEHRTLCEQLGLRGRIIVAAEGINGTVSGTKAQTDAYVKALHADPRFADMPFKIDEATEHAFPKLKVKVKREIVNLNLSDDIDPNILSGKRLSPEQFYEALQDDDCIVIDGRNDYEYDIGHFRGAIRPDVKTFREFPDWIRENLQPYKHKKVLTYCTGGIRCEKLSGLLLREGFTDVSQLDGGIVTYGKHPEVQGKRYDGKCYVFDKRISVPVNQTEDVVVGKCYHCGKPEDRYVNCANPECHLQHICCDACERKYRRSCSDACRAHPRNRYELESSGHAHS